MYNTRSRTRTPEKGIDTATPQRQSLQNEEISAISPGNVSSQFKPGKKSKLDPPLTTYVSRRQSRSAQLPQPTTREVSSEEGSVIQDVDVPPEYWNDPRIAIPRPRKGSAHAHGPWRYSTAQNQNALIREDPGIPGLDINSVERASMSLAHQMLIKEHDRQVNKLGKKIYDSVMRVPTIDEAIFDSDSDDSDYTGHGSPIALPSPAPGLGVLDTLRRWWLVPVVFGLAFVGLARWFELADFSKFDILNCTAVGLLFVLTVGIMTELNLWDERQRQAKRGSVLRSGYVYNDGTTRARF